MTAPQPSSNALPITFAFVPGGPEPMMNGLESLRPLTVTDKSGVDIGITPGPRPLPGGEGSVAANSISLLRLQFDQFCASTVYPSDAMPSAAVDAIAGSVVVRSTVPALCDAAHAVTPGSLASLA